MRVLFAVSSKHRSTLSSWRPSFQYISAASSRYSRRFFTLAERSSKIHGRLYYPPRRSVRTTRARAISAFILKAFRVGASVAPLFLLVLLWGRFATPDAISPTTATPPANRIKVHDPAAINVAHVPKISQPNLSVMDSVKQETTTVNIPSHRLTKGSYSYMNFNQQVEANIVFFLQLSLSSLPLAPRLIERLWHEKNILILHIDAKVPQSDVDKFEKKYARIPRYTNVHFLPRESITYMGITMLTNTLAAMEYALSLSAPWDYFINISGSDYPTVSVHNMRNLLGQPEIVGRKVSFLQYSPDQLFWKQLKLWRFDSQFVDPGIGIMPNVPVNTKLEQLSTKHPLSRRLDLVFVHSEAWVTAHRSFATQAARGSFARRLLALLGGMRDPEEHFFGMLAWNLKELNETTAHHAGRGIFWVLNGKKSGQHPHTIDQHTEPDGSYSFLPRILHSPNMFVRKFSTVDSPLMDTIDQMKSGVHQNPNTDSVKRSFEHLRFMTMCNADLKEHWNSPRIFPC